MKLLLDEMHAPTVAGRLRYRGHDAIAVKERADLIGLTDEVLLRAATTDGRSIVTENVKDFAALHRSISAAGHQHSGLIFTVLAGSLARPATMRACWPIRLRSSWTSTAPCSTKSSRSSGG